MNLITPRLRLREYAEDDFEGVHAYSRDPETVQFMTWGPNSPEDTRTFIRTAIEQQTSEPRLNYHFVVTLVNDGRIIGGCGIHLRNPEQRSAEIGYCFHKSYWGQGFASEAAAALLRFGFERLNLHRILATCDPRNLGSARVMEKNGMRREAHFIENLWQKGAWRDSWLYAILEREWRQQSSNLSK